VKKGLSFALALGLSASASAENTFDLVVSLGGSQSANHSFSETTQSWKGTVAGDALASARDPVFNLALPSEPSNQIHIRILSAGKRLVSEAFAPNRTVLQGPLTTEGQSVAPARVERTVVQDWRGRRRDAPREETSRTLGATLQVASSKTDSVAREVGTATAARSARLTSASRAVGAKTTSKTAGRERQVGGSALTSTDHLSQRHVTLSGQSTRSDDYASDQKTDATLAGVTSTDATSERAISKAGLGTIGGGGRASSSLNQDTVNLAASGGAGANRSVTGRQIGVREERSLSEIHDEWRRLGLLSEGFSGGHGEVLPESVKYPFGLVLTADHYEVWPGEIITVTATFENRSEHELVRPEVVLAIPRGLRAVEIKPPTVTGEESAVSRITDDMLAQWSLAGTYGPGATVSMTVRIQCGITRKEIQ
jgi:hypothetical protein